MIESDLNNKNNIENNNAIEEEKENEGFINM